MRTAVWMAADVSGRTRSSKVEHTHVEATGNAGTLQGLVTGVSAANGHQTGHLDLSELNLAAPEGSEGLESQQLER